MVTGDLYLDCNATLPASAGLRAALSRELGQAWANPASPHPAGRHAEARLQRARGRIAAQVGASAEQLVFTSSGSEANLLALSGLAPAGAPVLISAIEHPSVLDARALLRRLGHEVVLAPCRTDGRVDVEQVLKALPGGCGLVSLMSANNETGVLQPVREVAAALAVSGIPLHVDAVQSFGKLPLDLGDLGAAALSLSGHKVGAPGGIGALVLAPGVDVRPLHGGSMQERGRRSGTPNLLGAIGWELALEHLPSEWSARPRDVFERGLLEGVPDLEVNGGSSPRLPSTSNLCFRGVAALELLGALGERGVHASTGSACRAGAARPSHVLRAMGRPVADVRSSLRFSFGPDATEGEAREATRRVLDALGRPATAGQDPA